MFDITEKTTLCGLPQGIYRVEELKTMGFTIKDYAVGGETNCDSFASLTDTDVVKNHFVLGAPVEKKPDADNDCNMFVWK